MNAHHCASARHCWLGFLNLHLYHSLQKLALLEIYQAFSARCLVQFCNLQKNFDMSQSSALNEINVVLHMCHYV